MRYKEELDKMIWSFSRIHLWEQCPYAFYLRYIEETLGERFDTKVRVYKNKLEIKYSNIEQLNRILEILNMGN